MAITDPEAIKFVNEYEGDVLAFTTGGTIATVTRVTCKLKVELA